MKKLLIITHNLYPNLGGVEKYNDLLINEFYSLFNIDICLIDNFSNLEKFKEYYKNKANILSFKKFKKWKQASINSLPKMILKYIKWFIIRKYISSKMDFDKYDYIIDETQLNFKKLRNKDNVFWVPHANLNRIISKSTKNDKLSIKIINFINTIIDKITKIKLTLKYYKNIICFSPNDVYKFKEYNKKYSKVKNQNYYFIPNCINNKNFNNVCDADSKKILTFCRFNNEQKNLKLLNEISKRLDNKIDVYGEGPDIKFLSSCNVFKSFDQNQLEDILKKYSLFIMTSNYEGFPFSVVESLSYGLPIIIRNSFDAAKYLIDKNNNGIIFNDNDNINQIVDNIKKLLNNNQEIKNKSNNAFLFSKKNLSIENFSKKWREIFKIDKI